MFFNEDKSQKNESKIQELAIQIENLDRETAKLLSELDVTPEQLTSFIQKEKNFTEKNWEELQAEKKKLNEKLLRDLRSICDPRKTKKAYKDRKVDNRWLFVK